MPCCPKQNINKNWIDNLLCYFQLASDSFIIWIHLDAVHFISWKEKQWHFFSSGSDKYHIWLAIALLKRIRCLTIITNWTFWKPTHREKVCVVQWLGHWAVTWGLVLNRPLICCLTCDTSWWCTFVFPLSCYLDCSCLGAGTVLPRLHCTSVSGGYWS